MAYKLLSQIKKRNKRGWGEDKREGAENSLEKNKRGDAYQGTETNCLLATISHTKITRPILFPPIAVLCADVTMPLGVQNETKGTSFKWYFNQNKNVDSF